MITCASEEIAALGRHRESHRALLRAIAPLVDAVVVPASRPVPQLAVVKIAEALGARFVALCSREARFADFSAWIGERPGLWWCRQVNSFFPEAYDEDWIFFCQVATTGSVRQLEYDSFAEPDGAGDEEFGEVLAEGLANLLYPSSGPEAVALDIPDAAFCAEYWRWFLRARAEFIEQIVSRIAKQPLSDVTYAALLSLKVADERRAGLCAEQCAVYRKTRKRDTADWCARWARLQLSSTLRQAVASLGLVQHAQSPQL